MKNKVYEALYDFEFQNIDNGSLVFVKVGETFQIKELDRSTDWVCIVSTDGHRAVWLSLYKFVTHFSEVRKCITK